jgi:membrane-bound metal-dependent hydrolase YbcI (DUF457 family)
MLPVIAALATGVHLKHKLRNIFLLGIVTVLLDIDHFYPIVNIFGNRLLFHNVFFLILIPLILIFYAFYYKKSYDFKGMSILTLIFFSSHLLLDVVYGGLKLFWPLSNETFGIAIEIGIAEGLIISPIGIVLVIYLIFIILPMMFLEEIMEIMNKKHKSFRKALKEVKILK